LLFTPVKQSIIIKSKYTTSTFLQRPVTYLGDVNQNLLSR
jgi:hypothetical protein